MQFACATKDNIKVLISDQIAATMLAPELRGDYTSGNYSCNQSEPRGQSIDCKTIMKKWTPQVRIIHNGQDWTGMDI